MQAQASGDAQGVLQNPKFQIGVIATFVVVMIVVLVSFFRPKPPPFDPAMPGGVPGSDVAPMYPGPEVSGMPGGYPGMPGDPSLGQPGMPGQPAATEEKPDGPPKPPGVPTRSNPFQLNSDLKAVIDSIPSFEGPVAIAQPHRIYVDELRKPKEEQVVSEHDQLDGPGIPPMRVAGVIHGRQVSATLQIGSEYMQVSPGQMVPSSNPVYRVERIEPDQVVLTRRWEMAGRSGVQRIEVPLSGFAGGPAGQGGYPGAPYPGAGPGMPYPGGSGAPFPPGGFPTPGGSSP